MKTYVSKVLKDSDDAVFLSNLYAELTLHSVGVFDMHHVYSDGQWWVIFNLYLFDEPEGEF